MIKRVINYLKQDYNRRVFIFAFTSGIVCCAYAIYNGIIGLSLRSVWNGSICVYYLFLLVARITVVLSEVRLKDKHKDGIIIILHLLMVIITVAMVTPIILLIKDKRTYNLGLIPAIAMAAYTTFSITRAIINVKKSGKSDNDYVRIIGLINMVSAIMSVAVLQNTLIVANGGYNQEMVTLSIWTSAFIVLVVVSLIVFSFVRFIKTRKNIDSTK